MRKELKARGIHHVKVLYSKEEPRKVFETEEKLVDVCPEKVFHPISDNTSVLIPLTGNTVTLYSIGNDMKLKKKLFPDALKQILD